jgi:hypothetical protein
MIREGVVGKGAYRAPTGRTLCVLNRRFPLFIFQLINRHILLDIFV